MNATRDEFSRLLRVGVLLWSSYFLLIAAFDALIWVQGPLPTAYVVFYGGSISLLLLLTFLSSPAIILKRAHPILVLLLMGLLPFLGEAFVLPQTGVQSLVRIFGSSGVYIRQWLPTVLVVALIAYNYSWTDLGLFMTLIIALNVALAVLRFPRESLVNALLFFILVDSSVVVLGLGINRTVWHLRKQQAALQDANLQLLELTTTAEDLAISRERNRMARDLHDTLAHSLSGLIIQLETVDAYWDVDPSMARDLLSQSVETTRSGLHETRRALKALRASPLADLGLALALKEMAETAAELGSLGLSVRLPQQTPILSKETEQCLYRVAQEAINNVVRHAKARNLELMLAQVNGRMVLDVRDDGEGFDVDELSQPGHYGLSGMKERARLASGSLTIASKHGSGTRITLDLPISRA